MDQSLLSLPDDVLLAVLAYLPPRQLLSCRVVSRRLRELCLDPHLWRTVQLLSLRDAGVLRAALRLAPCVSHIVVQSSHLKSVASDVVNTKCVVTRLWMRVKSESTAAWATAILLKISALGGLKTIVLDLTSGFNIEALFPLYTVVQSVDDLRELFIRADFDTSPLSFWSHKETRPSLTIVNFTSVAIDSFLLFMLRAHAATLEELTLKGMVQLPLSLLKTMPMLRSLTCHPCDDLSQLETVSPLDTLVLVDNNQGTFPLGTVRFLGQASHLRDVSFLVKALPLAPLQALSQSPSACVLETLTLYGASDLLGAVSAILPSFPSLRTLTLDAAPSDNFLRAVDHSSAPSLTTLTMKRPEGEACPHGFLHDPAIGDLLQRNPGLHFKMRGENRPSQGCSCRWCRWGCHEELREGNGAGLRSAFASHSRSNGCPSDCFTWP